MSHELSARRDLGARLPRGVELAYDGLVLDLGVSGWFDRLP